ncbi:hypothetical protein [Rouxiella badensis]|uniref:hypothetical protein n=1 Tax=Rouxiella badensis TaxID=1646377 RepID=UPI0009D98264|nr:hypothetical protein [Rouxiella badensis]WAT10147.2 hypothetical protein O1V65_06175 [Rouxiella badensis]
MGKGSSLKVGGKLQAAIARINTVKNISMKVGVLDGATNPETGEKIAPYAAANEFGHMVRGGKYFVLPRPAFRNTIAAKSDSWGDGLSYQLALKPISGESVKAALQLLGSVMVSDIQATIEAGEFAPLAPVTIAEKTKKGRAEPEKPMVDTGAYQRAIDYEIIE